MGSDDFARAKALSDALNSINEIIHSTREADLIMRRVVVEACELVGAESAAIVLKEDDNWVVRHVHNLPGPTIGRILTSAQTKATLLAVEERQPLIIEDALNDSRVDRDLCVEFGVRSLLVIPLSNDSEIFGGLLFNYHSEPVAFSEAEIDFARKLKATMSLALENASLYVLEKEAMRFSKALNDIHMIISAGLDFDEIMRKVVGAAAEAVGSETAVIDMREDEWWVIKYLHGMPAELEGVRMTGNEVQHAAIVARTREPLVVADAYADERLHQDLIRQYRIRSFLTIPLLVRGQVIGCLSFHYHSEPVPFTGAQVDFSNKLAASLSLALENARLYESEHRISATLQEALLKMPQRVTGVSFGHLYSSATSEAAEVGGDFYDLFELEHGRLAMVIGDVSGKGLEAATLTSLVKNTVKAYAYENKSAAAVVAKTNNVICRSAVAGTLVTLFFGFLNLADNTLDYCNAGHPPPSLKRGHSARFIEEHCMALGFFRDFVFESSQVKLAKGDVLLLYTDGAIEARGSDGMFGEESLLEFVRESPGEAIELPALLFKKIMAFTGELLRDDVAFLALSPNSRRHFINLDRPPC